MSTPRFFEVPFGMPRGRPRAAIASREPGRIDARRRRGRSRCAARSTASTRRADGDVPRLGLQDRRRRSRSTKARGLHGGRQIQHALYALALEALLGARRARRRASRVRATSSRAARARASACAMPLDAGEDARGPGPLMDLLARRRVPARARQGGLRVLRLRGGLRRRSDAAARSQGASSQRRRFRRLRAFRELHGERVIARAPAPSDEAARQRHPRGARHDAARRGGGRHRQDDEPGRADGRADPHRAHAVDRISRRDVHDQGRGASSPSGSRTRSRSGARRETDAEPPARARRGALARWTPASSARSTRSARGCSASVPSRPASIPASRRWTSRRTTSRAARRGSATRERLFVDGEPAPPAPVGARRAAGGPARDLRRALRERGRRCRPFGPETPPPDFADGAARASPRSSARGRRSCPPSGRPAAGPSIQDAVRRALRLEALLDPPTRRRVRRGRSTRSTAAARSATKARRGWARAFEALRAATSSSPRCGAGASTCYPIVMAVVVAARSPTTRPGAGGTAASTSRTCCSLARDLLRDHPRRPPRLPAALPADPRRRVPGHGPDPGRDPLLPDGPRPAERDWRSCRPAARARSSSSAIRSSRSTGSGAPTS